MYPVDTRHALVTQALLVDLIPDGVLITDTPN